MHAKSDSEDTSLAPSSPRRPVYYVQSPSRDSHDGEKMSFQSTPILSPMGSPPHSSSSLGRHSRESSTSRFSGSLKPGSRKLQPHGLRHGKSGKSWKQFSAIEEEEPYDDIDEHKSYPRICYFCFAIVLFAVLFTIFALCLWGAARSFHPQVKVKSIIFHNFYTSAGSDATGVPTRMITLNSTLKMSYHNPANFYGLHVISTPMNLMYYDLAVASGQVKEFYAKKKSRQTLSVIMYGNKVPLYGGGAGWSNTQQSGPVPLGLTFTVRSRAYVLGKLVKPKFLVHIHCNITLNSNKLMTTRSLNNACKYS